MNALSISLSSSSKADVQMYVLAAVEQGHITVTVSGTSCASRIKAAGERAWLREVLAFGPTKTTSPESKAVLRREGLPTDILGFCENRGRDNNRLVYAR